MSSSEFSFFQVHSVIFRVLVSTSLMLSQKHLCRKSTSLCISHTITWSDQSISLQVPLIVHVLTTRQRQHRHLHPEISPSRQTLVKWLTAVLGALARTAQGSATTASASRASVIFWTWPRCLVSKNAQSEQIVRASGSFHQQTHKLHHHHPAPLVLLTTAMHLLQDGFRSRFYSLCLYWPRWPWVRRHERGTEHSTVSLERVFFTDRG